MYLHIKFHFNSFSRLRYLFYTTMSLAAILDPRWRVFQNVGLFPLPTHGPTPLFQIWCFLLQ